MTAKINILGNKIPKDSLPSLIDKFLSTSWGRYLSWWEHFSMHIVCYTNAASTTLPYVII